MLVFVIFNTIILVKDKSRMSLNLQIEIFKTRFSIGAKQKIVQYFERPVRGEYGYVAHIKRGWFGFPLTFIAARTGNRRKNIFHSS